MPAVVPDNVKNRRGAIEDVSAVMQVDQNGEYAGGAGGGGGGGDANAANQATQITAEQAILASVGAVAGAAVITDANGTVQQYLRGLVKRWADALGAGTAAAALRVAFASDTALPAGTNNIGDVDLASAIPAGSAVIGKVDHTTTGIGHGVTVVTTAGTDVALAASTPAKWVTIQAQSDNTTRVAVGATGVDAVIATGNGISLAAGDSITLPVDNLADVFIDALTNGEGVRYVYGT